MTEAQLEIAVYNYCGIMGIDAHEDIPVESESESESELQVARYEKRFHAVKRMIQAHWAVMKSIDFALNPPVES